jgi:hypothetical protein
LFFAASLFGPTPVSAQSEAAFFVPSAGLLSELSDRLTVDSPLQARFTSRRCELAELICYCVSDSVHGDSFGSVSAVRVEHFQGRIQGVEVYVASWDSDDNEMSGLVMNDGNTALSAQTAVRGKDGWELTGVVFGEVERATNSCEHVSMSVRAAASAERLVLPAD